MADTPAPDTSVCASLEAAVAEHSETPSESRAPTTSDAPAGAAVVTPAAEAVLPASPAGASPDGRQRGADGKFLPKSGDGGSAGAPAADADNDAKPQDQAVATPASDKREAIETLDPPVKWEERDKAIYAKLPADAKEMVRRHADAMEKAHTQRSMEVSALRREAEPLLAIFEPHMEAIRLAGMTPAAVVQRWAAAEKKLQTDPVAAIEWLAREYVGMDLQEIAQRVAASQQPVDPTLAPVLSELNELKTWRANQEQASQRYNQQQGQAYLQSIENKIEAFAAEKDEKGQAKHPYINDVLSAMIVLSNVDREAGRQPDLADLYDRAVWQDTGIRTKMLDAQATSKAAEDVEKAKATARQAMGAGSSIGGASRPNGAHVPNRSLRDELVAGFADRGL